MVEKGAAWQRCEAASGFQFAAFGIGAFALLMGRRMRFFSFGRFSWQRRRLARLPGGFSGCARRRTVGAFFVKTAFDGHSRGG